MVFLHDPREDARRRRLRKGTHSCWECKRRKMRCVFDPTTCATACKGCERRGSPCVGQEFPEEFTPTADRAPTAAPPDASPEASDIGWTPGASSDEDRCRRGTVAITTPLGSILSSDSSHYQFLFESSSKPHDKYGRLSQLLYQSLPSQEDMRRICDASRHLSVLTDGIMTTPYTILEQNGLKSYNSLLKTPEPDAHPVLIARYMLQLAFFILQLHPDSQEEIRCLSEPLRVVRERLFNLVVRLITTSDEFVASVEGLECIIIESVYQANLGNIHRSWIACRRAMSMAQLMGLNRSSPWSQHKVLHPGTQYYPELMWYRIVFLDRYLSLMLGVSQGSGDCSMASETILASDTPMGRLDRVHCVVACRILERNETRTTGHRSPSELALTQNIETELQKVARSLPSSWWLAPRLDAASADSQRLFWETRQIMAQVFHYNLLNQLHLPYMLASSTDGGASHQRQQQQYEHSRSTCVNASREVLTRFTALRSLKETAYSCRTVDFLALMAAITLLLAHLEEVGRLTPTGADTDTTTTIAGAGVGAGFLAHQYASDRAMIERVHENMCDVNRLSSDTLGAQSAQLLRRLLAIDVQGEAVGAGRVSVQVTTAAEATAPPASDPGQNQTLIASMRVPYFGLVRISRRDVGRENAGPPPHQAALAETMQRFFCTAESAGAAYSAPQEMHSLSPEEGSTLDAGYGFGPPVVSQPWQQEEYARLAGLENDWTSQGTQLAFFESLIAGSSGAGNLG
ncbi:hypothetical protein PG984_006356 [Apiospora sp. TS-2023a]